jgi:hypothetical protein
MRDPKEPDGHRAILGLGACSGASFVPYLAPFFRLQILSCVTTTQPTFTTETTESQTPPPPPYQVTFQTNIMHGDSDTNNGCEPLSSNGKTKAFSA